MLNFWVWLASAAFLTSGIISVASFLRVQDDTAVADIAPAPATAAVRRKLLRFVFIIISSGL
jgi:hypothetical protein